MKLYIVGLGVESGDLSYRALSVIKNAPTVVVRTSKTPSTNFLEELNISYTSLDEIYESSRSFDTLSKNLAKKVQEFLKRSDVCYLLEGAVSEDVSANILINKHRDTVVFEGVSKANHALSAVGIISNGFKVYSAYQFEEEVTDFPIAIVGIDSQILASYWKLKLSKMLGDVYKVRLYIDKMPFLLPIYEIDRQIGYSYSTVLIVEKPNLLSKEFYTLSDLTEIIRMLRAPSGCPWDRAQTVQTIRKNLIEECYELVDAIDLNEDDKMQEEIGDVLMQAVFHAVFAEERGAFNINDVITQVCKKLIFRHSHIFGTDSALREDDALDIWDKNKLLEKDISGYKEYINDIPKAFPSLLRAQKVLKRMKKYNLVNIDEDYAKEQVYKLITEESDHRRLGRLLLLICILFNYYGLDAEEELYFAIEKLVLRLNKDTGFSFREYLSNDED